MTIAAPFALSAITPASAEIAIFAAASIVLLADVFGEKEKPGTSNGVVFLLALLGLAAGGIAAIVMGGRESSLLFSGMFIDDPLGRMLKVALVIAVATTLVYSRDYLKARNLFTGEFLALTLFATLGMMVMITAHNFVTLYVGLELQALALYAIIALQRDSAQATEAAMKYFILGALASGLLLYGMSMVYGGTGSLDLTQVARAIESGRANSTLTVFGLVFIVAGLGFKLGAVPFHMWVPDVYQGSATPATLLVGAAPKIAALAFILRLLGDGLAGIVGEWRDMLVILAALSIGFGNVIAIAQTNLKRMLAYSTISHMGFLLLGILAGTQNGYASATFYVITYTLMTLLSFGMILLLSRQGFEAEELEDLRGLNQRSRWYAFLMLVVMFSLAGIPPTVGFFGKLLVLQAAWDVGQGPLVVFAVLMSVIGAFYYLRVVKLMYMEEPVDTTPITVSSDFNALISVNALAVLALGILPTPLMAICVGVVKASLQ